MYFELIAATCNTVRVLYLTDKEDHLTKTPKESEIPCTSYALIQYFVHLQGTRTKEGVKYGIGQISRNGRERNIRIILQDSKRSL